MKYSIDFKKRDENGELTNEIKLENLEKKHHVLGFMDKELYECSECNSKLVDAGSTTEDDYVFWCSNKNCKEYKEHFYSFSLDGLYDRFFKRNKGK